MEYSEWGPHYRRIAEEFGFPFDAELRSADRLESLLPVPARASPLDRIARRLSGRDVVVVGTAAGAGPPPIWRLPTTAPRAAVMAADGATAACLEGGIVPEVIATDLDGTMPAEVVANGRGSLVVVHAHGDNLPAIDEWVPQFPAELAGSWAGPPRPALIDVGGFTDGDRAVFLAEHVRAHRVLLWGFDFEIPAETETAARERKRAKLAWARRSLDALAARTPVPILTWQRDGTLVPYAGGRYVASTK